MTDGLTKAERAAVRKADSPWTIVRHDWKAVLKQTWTDSGTDNIGLIAAGTAFWGFASIAPLLGAVVLSYGLFATPETVADNIRSLFGVLPRDAAALIADQLKNVVGTSGGKQGWALVLALALALYGGTQGASAIVTALNVAYEEKEDRGFVRLYVLAFAITGAAVLVAIAAAGTTAVTRLHRRIDAACTRHRADRDTDRQLPDPRLHRRDGRGAAVPVRAGSQACPLGLADPRVVSSDRAVAARDSRVRFLRVRGSAATARPMARSARWWCCNCGCGCRPTSSSSAPN